MEACSTLVLCSIVSLIISPSLFSSSSSSVQSSSIMSSGASTSLTLLAIYSILTFVAPWLLWARMSIRISSRGFISLLHIMCDFDLCSKYIFLNSSSSSDYSPDKSSYGHSLSSSHLAQTGWRYSSKASFGMLLIYCIMKGCKCSGWRSSRTLLALWKYSVSELSPFLLK